MAEQQTPRDAADQGLRAWQAGIDAAVRAWLPPFAGRSDADQEAAGRIIARLTDLAGAQAAVAAGWLRLPFALAGGNADAAQTLQRDYARLGQAYTDLFRAYLAASVPGRQAAAAHVRDAAGQPSAAPASTDRAAPPATPTSRNGAATTARSKTSAGRTAEAKQPLGSGPIKGKIGRDGARIYHKPGQANYGRFQADRLFETEEEARAAGFRAAQR